MSGSFCLSRLGVCAFAASLSLSVLCALPAHAQISGTYTYDSGKHAYFIQGDTTIDGAIGSNDVFVGKDNATLFTTLDPATPITLSISGSAFLSDHGGTYPDGKFYSGVNVFGHNQASIDGVTGHVSSYDYSTISLNAGSEWHQVDAYNSSTIQASGYAGGAGSVTVHDTATINVGNTNGLLSAVAMDQGTLNLDGAFLWVPVNSAGVTGQGSSTVNINAIAADYIASYDSSTVNVNGTQSGHFWQTTDITAAGNSTMNLFKGKFGTVTVSDSANLNISGGTISGNLNVMGNNTVSLSNINVASGVDISGAHLQIGTGATVLGVGASNSSTVDLMGGVASNVSADHSTVNFSAGNNAASFVSAVNGSTINVTGSSQGATFNAQDSMVNISGGTGTMFSAHGTSSVNITGGNVEIASLYGTISFTMSGGSLHQFENGVSDNSTFGISGGTIGSQVWIGDLNDTFAFSGGNIATDFFGGNTLINWTGGTVDDKTIYLAQDSIIDLYGSGLSLSFLGTGNDGFRDYSTYALSGILLDGTNLNGYQVIDYRDGGYDVGNAGPSPVRLHISSSVPEPGSLALLAMAALPIAGLVRRRKA